MLDKTEFECFTYHKTLLVMDVRRDYPTLNKKVIFKVNAFNTLSPTNNGLIIMIFQGFSW